MKKSLLYLFIVCAAISSCRKKDNNKESYSLGDNYPAALNKMVTPAIISALKLHGMAIYGGFTPPVINGSYILSPDSCIYDNSGAQSAGEIFYSYQLSFSNQNNTNSSIIFNYTNIGNDADSHIGDSTSTFITGTNNDFTVFTQSESVVGGISNTTLVIVSGTLQNGAINNLQLSTYLLSKSNDPTGVLEPVGSTRIFVDEDGLSEKSVN